MGKDKFCYFSLGICLAVLVSGQVWAAPSFFCTKSEEGCLSSSSGDGVRDLFNTGVMEVNEAEEPVLHRKKISKSIEKDTPQKIRSQENKAVGKQPIESISEIINEFGAPTEEEPVLPEEKAPRPFKAMMHAINLGNDELALAYAEKYVRYMDKVQSTVSHAVNLIGVQQVKQGIQDADSWIKDDAFKEYHHLLKDDAAKTGSEENGGEGAEKTIREKALEVLKKAKNRKAEDSIILELDEDEERARARKTLTGIVPVDRKGRVMCMFFFKDRDQDAVGIAPDIERLYKTVQKEKRIDFKGYTINQLNKISLQLFREKTGASFPVISGAQFAKKLEIVKSPTIVFVTGNGEYQIDGPENYYFLHEALQIMKGE